jgi:hypothetical protein
LTLNQKKQANNSLLKSITKNSMKNSILSPMKSWLTLLSLLLCVELTWAQSAPGSILVNTGTSLATSNSTQIAFTGNLTINSEAADLSKTILTLAGANQDLRMTRGGSLLVLGGIVIGPTGGGTAGNKNLFGGTWEIAGTLIFNDGVVVPQTASNGKLVHSISPGTTSSITVNNPDSYFNGTFFSKGTGTRFFPIGNGSGYFPAQLSGVTQGDLEVGMVVRNSNAGLTHGSEILSTFPSQYWELIDPGNSLADAFVSVSTLGAGNYIDPNIGTVLFTGATINSGGTSLDGSISGDFLTAGKPITTNNRIFTLAQISNEQAKVKIRNVITPFLDNANDYLEIENINLFPDNKVILLDRWGVQVKEWAGYTNVGANPDATYDLSKIATGNYIVILEYKDGSSIKKLSQMVTIINQ